MTKYEYKFLETSDYPEKQLNELGPKGWEVVGLSEDDNHWHIILMREIGDNENELLWELVSQLKAKITEKDFKLLWNANPKAAEIMGFKFDNETEKK